MACCYFKDAQQTEAHNLLAEAYRDKMRQTCLHIGLGMTFGVYLWRMTS